MDKQTQKNVLKLIAEITNDPEAPEDLLNDSAALADTILMELNIPEVQRDAVQAFVSRHM